MSKITTNFSAFLCFFLLSGVLYAQRLDFVQGELLIQLEKTSLPSDLISEYEAQHGPQANLSMGRKLKAPMEVWKFSFDYNAIDNNLIIRQLDRMRSVRVVQNNHLISPRATFPDDPQFSSQWQWFNDGSSGTADADVDAELAWDITTGGMTPEGDEIVVAVLDDGTELTHPDLMDNHWVNVDEIPDNNIDDDGNGYIDDYNGWSIITDNDIVSGGNHGVAVSGMIGAKGNNGIGVSGINWDVKIMTVKNNFSTAEDRVLEAYAYPYIMRKRYNESNGMEGAFVVASNASWGIDGGDPSDSPLWCQFYDSLGVQGILNCGATSNSSIDVDAEGDLPTACPSDYMVAVTRSSITDEQSGGFGPINIDLAAPGNNIFSTSSGANYSSTTGTSFSCPLVAGIVGLMYSAPCPNLTALAKSNPAEAALEVRRLLLENVDLVSGFEFLVSSGGRANAFNALAEIVETCGPCPGPRTLNVNTITISSAEVSWIDGANTTGTNIRFKEIGSMDWTNILGATSPYVLSSLSSCTSYEFQIENECADSMAVSDFSASVVFVTDGCCEAPSNIQLDTAYSSSLAFSWDAVTLADSYDVRYRVVGNMDWTIINTPTNDITINDLTYCQDYEIAVKTNCVGISNDFSNSIFISTKGCGNCDEINYCEAVGNASLEFIDKVTINDFENQTGSDGGYSFFDSEPLVMTIDSSYNLTVHIGYAGTSYDETTTAFIDFNLDGEFSNDENIGNIVQQDSASFDFTIPNTASEGISRMRVIVGYQLNPDDECPSNLNGEMEDYCLFLDNPLIGCEFVGQIDTTSTTVSSIQLEWENQAKAIQYQLRWKESTATDWNGVIVEDNNYNLTDLEKCTAYDFQLATICLDGFSTFSEVETHTTACFSSLTEANQFSAFSLAPNPFTEQLNLSFDSPVSGPLEINILNNVGQSLLINDVHSISTGSNQITLDQMENLTSGIYFLSLKIKGFHKVVKVVKI